MLRIKELRTEKKWSQRYLAAQINASPKTVNLWERGISEPTAGFIIKLADCFGCSVDYLLGREDDYGNVNINSDLTDTQKNLLSLYDGLANSDKEDWLKYGYYLRFKGGIK